MKTTIKIINDDLTVGTYKAIHLTFKIRLIVETIFNNVQYLLTVLNKLSMQLFSLIQRRFLAIKEYIKKSFF